MAGADRAARTRAVVDPDFGAELFSKGTRNRAGEDVAAAPCRERNNEAGGFGVGESVGGECSARGQSHEKAGVLNDLTTRKHEGQLQR